uniref:Galectin n=1 Tax=Panagrellus redivivus TaxID=6233 RepID=A0A7E4UUN3_PANRE
MAHPQDTALPVPYTSRLQEKINSGQTLFVHGKALENANFFTVNLLAGTPVIDPNVGAVALHINVRFAEGKIVLNTLENGNWGKEERVSTPFKPGQEFDLRIRAQDDKFEIIANQKEIHEYKYRVPLESIDFLNVVGDINLTGIHWGGRHFELPFQTGFPTGSLKAGDRILVYGTPQGKRFEVNFIGPNGDTLVHFNPRFDQSAVVRNSQINGQWGQEEREGGFPFKKEVGFDLVIVNEPYSIQFFINNERYGTFAHRTANPATDYVGLKIDGEFELTGLEFSHQ